jgi:hypothetical protein
MITSAYSKVYPLSRFREFSAWREKTALKHTEGPESYAFLHENFVVTADIFVDEQIVFDEITPEWIDFCTNFLGFSVPVDISAMSSLPK